jgi:tetratricopeptide (TPR) repeat protein
MSIARAVIVILLVVGAVPTLASAEPAGAQAEVLFREGRALMTAGKIAEACAALEQSQKLDPAPTTLINLAACREKLGQIATAWGLFLEAERQTRSASDPAAQQLNKVARERAAKLESRVPKLTISVPDRSKMDGLEVVRDKESIPAVMWNRALPVDGGTYTITARAPGANEWSTRVTIASEADTKTVDIPDLRNLKPDLDRGATVTAGAAQPAPPPSPSPPPSPESASPEQAGQRGSFAPIVVGAGAVALLGGALGLSLWGDSTYDKAKAEMTDQARRDSLYDSANLKRYAAEGLAVVGVGCAGVAVWLYLRQRGARAETASARAGELMLTPTASGIGVVGRF